MITHTAVKLSNTKLVNQICMVHLCIGCFDLLQLTNSSTLRYKAVTYLSH